MAISLSGFQSPCDAAIPFDGGGDGTTWGDGLNWNPDGTPAPNQDASLGGFGVTVPAAHINFINAITIGDDGTLTIHGSLNAAGDVHNGNIILIDRGVVAGPASLTLAAGALDGDGEIVLGESITGAGGASLVGPPTGARTQAAEHAIRGEGQITGAWNNLGLIQAEDVDGNLAGVLRIGADVVNHGVIRSSATGTLSFGATLTQGETGRVIADAQTIQLNNARFIGGAFETVNGGRFESTGNALRFDGVHLKGTLHMVNPSTVGTLGVQGAGFTNDGVIELSPDNPGASLVFTSTATIGGTGEIVLKKGGIGSRILSNVGVVGTFGAEQTVRGAGQISAAIVNDGVIAAQLIDAGVLELNTSSAEATKTNNNVMRADLGAVLRVTATTVSQAPANGRLIANEGTVELANAPFNAANVIGGRLQTVGAGTIEIAGNARVDSAVNEGALNIQPARSLTIGGTGMTNNAAITLKNSMSALGGAGLILRDGATLSGTGQVVLNPELPSRENSVTVPTGATAAHAAGHTIRGEGFINPSGNAGTLVNNGRLEGTSAVDNIKVLRGTLAGTGVLKNVQINGNAFHNPGQGVASVALEGAYTIANSGHLQIDLGGTTAGAEYDQLASTDPANLITLNSGSILDVQFVSLGNSYIPTAGDEFTILTSTNAISGNFSTLNLPSIGLGRAIAWEPVDRTDPTKYILRIAAVDFLDADFDEDFDVDADDLEAWTTGFGIAAATHLQGDANDDGDVDGDDFLVWQRQLGAAAPPAAFTVPEPAAGLLTALSAVIMIQRRRPNIALAVIRR